jgi:hypothetical protein
MNLTQALPIKINKWSYSPDIKKMAIERYSARPKLPLENTDFACVRLDDQQYQVVAACLYAGIPY